MRRNLTPWGRKVKIAMMDRDWTREDLAKVAGISPNYISMILRDTDPAPEGVKKINDALCIAAPADSTA